MPTPKHELPQNSASEAGSVFPLALASAKSALLLVLSGAFLFGDPLILRSKLMVGIYGRRAIEIADGPVIIAFVVIR